MSEKTIKERIKQTAHDLVMQYGIRSVSMDDIAAALGISKKTIYQVFADKDELVLAVVTDVTGKSESDCERDKKRAQNAIHEVFLAMEMVVEMFRTMNPSIIHDIQKYHPMAFAVFQKHKNEYVYDVMRDNLSKGIREELYRPEINVDILAKFRVESMLLPFYPEFQRSMKNSLVEIEEELITHFLFGLVTPKGYKLILKYQNERKKMSNCDEKKTPA
jgi:TetR/AcrR family transcriptional regulator, cholesterol catabolism regulator